MKEMYIKDVMTDLNKMQEHIKDLELRICSLEGIIQSLRGYGIIVDSKVMSKGTAAEWE